MSAIPLRIGSYVLDRHQRDEIGPHVVGPEFQRERFDETEQTVLGRDYVGALRLRRNRGLAAERDDAARLALHHRRHDGLGEIEERVEVDRERLVPLLVADLPE